MYKQTVGGDGGEGGDGVCVTSSNLARGSEVHATHASGHSVCAWLGIIYVDVDGLEKWYTCMIWCWS